MSRLARTVTAIAAVSLLALAGCSSSGSSNSDAPDSEQVLTTYFEAFGTDKSSTMKPMIESSEPGSPARVYADHQINATLAYESDNAPSQPSTVTVDGDTVTMVLAGLSEDATEEQKQAETNVYSDFVFSPSGKLQTWTAEPGGALEDRIFAQKGKASSNKVTLKLKTAYQTNAGDLIITYDATNDSGIKTQVTPEGYINPDKRQVKAQGTPSMVDMAPDTFTTNSVWIQNGSVGGKLTFTVLQTEGTYNSVTLTIPVKGATS